MLVALEIPFVMDARSARFVISDGERIELDATEGIVTRLGRREKTN